MASRYWDAERGGWVVTIPGSDDGTGKPVTYLSNSEQGKNWEKTWKEEAQAKKDAHYANVGNWQQYKDASLDDFVSALNGDDWFYSRLARYANDIRNGDEYGTMQYNHQFNPSSGATARGHELTNRYIALLNQGYSNAEIMGAGYGNDGSFWAGFDKQNAGSSNGGGNTGSNTGMFGGITPGQRKERTGVWGSGHGDRRPDPSNAPKPADPSIPRPTPDVFPPQATNNSPLEDKLWPGNGMMSSDSEGMRKTIVNALEKKLLG